MARLPVLRRDVAQIAGRGNDEDLLDDVHELVQAGPEDSDRHGGVVTRRCLAGQITATAFPPSNGRRRASVRAPPASATWQQAVPAHAATSSLPAGRRRYKWLTEYGS